MKKTEDMLKVDLDRLKKQRTEMEKRQAIEKQIAEEKAKIDSLTPPSFFKRIFLRQ